MKLYTNKFPVFTGYPTFDDKGKIQADEFCEEIAAGKIFKMIGVTEITVLLSCEGNIATLSSEVFKLAFEETEVDI